MKITTYERALSGLLSLAIFGSFLFSGEKRLMMTGLVSGIALALLLSISIRHSKR